MFQNLVKSLKSVLHSHLEDVALALLMVPAQFDAHLLRQATKVKSHHTQTIFESSLLLQLCQKKITENKSFITLKGKSREAKGLGSTCLK